MHKSSSNLLSMYRTQASKHTWAQASEEVVDDSEPERVQLRKSRQRVQRTSHAHPLVSQSRTAAVEAIINSVIEISDSDSQSSSSTSRRPISPRPYSEIQVMEIEAGPSLMPLTSPSSAEQANASRPPSSASSSSKGALNLNRFAYATTIPKQKLPALSNLPATCATTSNLTIGRRKISTKASVSSPLEISNSDLGKILKCICCDISWTTRKSGPQKMTHIRACAKKFSMDNETVQILVQKEVALHSQGQTDGVKKPSQEPTQPQTFLEEVLVDAAPKRRGRPPQAATLLANVSHSRVNILARAQAIIEIATPDESGFLQANDTRDPSPEQASLPPPTQRFAQSTLGQLQGARTRSLFEGESGPSRLTQNFAPSGLAQLRGSRTRSLFADDWSLRSDEEDHDLAIGRRSPSPIQEVEDDIFQLPNGAVTPLVESPIKKSNKSIGDKRKGNSSDVLTESPRPSSLLMPAKVRSGSRARVKSASSSESENVKIAPVAPKKSRRPRAKGPSTKKSARVQYDFGEKWEMHMMGHITKDLDLHMRVLRYEPIHFDVFLELAQLYAPSSRQMKLQLQIFLDNQAIHFHGAEGIAWKR